MAERSYKYVTSADDLSEVAQAIADSKHMGLDLETTGLDPLLCKIRLLTITTDAGTWIIDVFQTQGPGMRIKHALNNYRGIVIGHNLKFDCKFMLHHWGVELQRVFDTFRASYMLYNGHPTITGHNLYDIQERYLHLKPNRENDFGASDWSGILSVEQIAYAAADTQHLIPLYRALVPQLQATGLIQACAIEFGAILPEAAIELNGIGLDKDMWVALSAVNLSAATAQREELKRRLPHPSGQMGLFGCTEFNLDSSQQIMQSFKRLGIDLPDTDKTTLAQYGHSQEILDYILYRKAQKKVTSFGLDYLQNIHPVTGRIHTSFWPLTGAGRYSSSNPNLQQLPREKAFRACFRPSKGHKYVMADYSQIEIRLIAHVSKDPTLIKVYRDNEDAYIRTANLISGIPYESVTKKQRQDAKPVKLGLMYGMGADKLVVYALTNFNTVFTRTEAQQYRSRYFKAFRQVKRWHDRAWEEGQIEKLSRTLTGRLRYLDPETDFNEFKNTPIQGSGADGLKAALKAAYYNLKKLSSSIKMVHMVHDEIITEVPDDRALCEEAARVLQKSMEEGMLQVMKNPAVPIVAEPGICDSWADK